MEEEKQRKKGKAARKAQRPRHFVYRAAVLDCTRHKSHAERQPRKRHNPNRLFLTPGFRPPLRDFRKRQIVIGTRL